MRITERHLDDFKGTESKGGFPAPASENNRYPMIDNNDWTAGFYTGILWMCWEYSGRQVFKDRAMEQIKSSVIGSTTVSLWTIMTWVLFTAFPAWQLISSREMSLQRRQPFWQRTT